MKRFNDMLKQWQTEKYINPTGFKCPCGEEIQGFVIPCPSGDIYHACCHVCDQAGSHKHEPNQTGSYKEAAQQVINKVSLGWKPEDGLITGVIAAQNGLSGYSPQQKARAQRAHENGLPAKKAGI